MLQSLALSRRGGGIEFVLPRIGLTKGESHGRRWVGDLQGCEY